MRRMGAAVAVAAVALAAAGCGGSGDKSSTEAAGVTTNDSAQTTDTTAGGPTGDCASLAKVSARFTEAMTKATSGNGSGVEAASKAFKELAGEAPEAVRDDFKALGEAFAVYAEALKGINLKAGTAPTAEQIKKLGEAAKSLDQKGVDAASSHIDAWVQANCKTTP